jgi:DNA-binding transcriptional ArsR family regulator
MLLFSSLAEDKDKKIEELSERIAELEASIRLITKPYTDLVDSMDRVQGIVNRYFRLLDIYQTHGGISIDAIIPQVKDPISKEIVRILIDHPRLNITQLADELKKRLGSSSRRIVRSKLLGLIEQGIVMECHEKKVKTYSVSDEVVRKWSQVLGLTK